MEYRDRLKNTLDYYRKEVKPILYLPDNQDYTLAYERINAVLDDIASIRKDSQKELPPQLNRHMSVFSTSLKSLQQHLSPNQDEIPIENTRIFVDIVIKALEEELEKSKQIK